MRSTRRGPRSRRAPCRAAGWRSSAPAWAPGCMSGGPRFFSAHGATLHVIPDPRQHSAEEILRDGGSILIRAIRPDDRERLVEHFGRLSARSVYFRFFNAKRRLTDDE